MIPESGPGDQESELILPSGDSKTGSGSETPGSERGKAPQAPQGPSPGLGLRPDGCPDPPPPADPTPQAQGRAPADPPPKVGRWGGPDPEPHRRGLARQRRIEGRIQTEGLTLTPKQLAERENNRAFRERVRLGQVRRRRTQRGGRHESHKPLWSAEQIREKLRTYDRTPFQDLLAAWLECSPTPEALSEFSERYPDRYASSLLQISRIAGFAERREVSASLTGRVQVEHLSDSQLEDKLRELAYEMGIPLPQVLELQALAGGQEALPASGREADPPQGGDVAPSGGLGASPQGMGKGPSSDPLQGGHLPASAPPRSAGK